MERNITLDYFKLVLSFLVIAIHTQSFFFEIPVVTWIIKNGISRIAVPCFFVINGFYLYPLIKDKIKALRYIKRVFILYVLWMIIYIPFHKEVDGSVSIPYYVRTIMVTVLGYQHLWYLSALVFGSIILYFTVKFKISDKILFVISLLLVLLGFFLNRLYLIDINIPTSTLTTNVVFVGFYYLFVGFLIGKYDVLGKLTKLKHISLAIVVLTVGLVLETYFLYTLDRPSHVLLVLPFLCPLLVIVIMKKGKIAKSNGFISKLSAAVYFVHYICISLASEIFNLSGVGLYIVTVLLSVLIGAVIVYQNKYTKMLL